MEEEEEENKKEHRNVLLLQKKNRVLLKSAKLQIIRHRFCNKAKLCEAR